MHATCRCTRLILAKGGDTHARLRFNVGPRAEFTIPVAIDYESPFPGVDEMTLTAWEAEYDGNVVTECTMWEQRSHQHDPFCNADEIDDFGLNDPLYEQLWDEWIIAQHQLGAEENEKVAQAS